MDFKEQWDLATAMKILQHQTVDAKLWAEAVEWLLLYGPPEVVSLLLQASSQAAVNTFAELKAVDDSRAKDLCYEVTALAKALEITEQEAEQIVARKGFTPGGSETIH